MSNVEVISLVASVASLILAVGAIWLSIVFFKMSSDALAATTEAAKGIAASVERLENLFDKLYTDTFSMMRDTVSDMRKHIWPTEESEPDKAIEDLEKKADAKITELKATMGEQLSHILQQQSIAEGKVSAIRKEMTPLIDKAILGSRQVETEAMEATIRENILRELRILREQQPTTTAKDLVDHLKDRVPFKRVLAELRRMNTVGLITLDGMVERPDNGLGIGPQTKILLAMPSVARSKPS